MTPAEHEQFFIEFVKQHDIMTHIKYREDKLEGQQIIGILVQEEPGPNNEQFNIFLGDLLREPNTIFIDPNYNAIYENFINIDFAKESVDYIKTVFESASTKEQLLELILNLIIKKLIASNIDASKVYFIIKPNWATDWLDKVIEV